MFFVTSLLNGLRVLKEVPEQLEIGFFFCILIVKELSAIHDKHLNRPTLDDNIDEEQTIEITTKEITQVGNINIFIWNHPFKINSVFFSLEI